MLYSPSTIQSPIIVRIPFSLHNQPVISNLIGEYGLRIIILAANLSGHGQEDGWFKLQLEGRDDQIQLALTYLRDQKVEFWVPSADRETENWEDLY